MKNGIKREYDTIPKNANELAIISKEIQKELNIEEIGKHKAIYAFPEPPKLKQVPNDTVVFELTVNEENVLLFDCIAMSRAIFDQIDYNQTKDKVYLRLLKQDLYTYWKSMILYEEYLQDKQKYKNYEVLIFSDVSPENIKIYYK
jgi:hypothetical protein